MTSLLSCLRWLDNKPVGGLLHLHPWDSDAADWAVERRVHRVVLAGAGVPSRQDLRRLAAENDCLELVDCTVNANAHGDLWRRFNISTLDGWLKPDPAGKVYPRLRLIDEEERQGSDLAELLRDMRFGKAGDGANILVLELPGHELAMLSPLASSALRTFDYVLIKSVREGVYEGANTSQALLQYMESKAYQLAAEDFANPQWPVRLFHFDEATAEREELKAKMQALNARLAEQSQLIATQKADIETSLTNYEGLRRELEEQRAVAEETLVRTRLDLQRAVEEEALQRQLHEQHVATEKTLAQKCFDLQRMGEEQSNLAIERLAQINSLSQVQATLQAQLEAVRSEKSVLERVIRSRAGWLAQERQRLREVERDQHHSSQQRLLLRDELVKAEAQINFIKEIALRKEPPL
jgi:hypothetical protein